MIRLTSRHRGALLLFGVIAVMLSGVAAAAADDTIDPEPIVVEETPDCGSPDAGDTVQCHSQTPSYDIVISEIMQNPFMVWDSVGEWFEIYNAGNVTVDLAGWTITDELNNTHVVAGPLVVDPGEYLVFGRNADSSVNGGVAVDYRTGTDIFLFNSSDRLVLLDNDGREVDRVVWDNGATFPDPNGASMSLTSIRSDNADDANWCTATTVFGDGDLGTPGWANSCATGTRMVISEIMQNPNAVSDAYGDWFEVYNPNGSPVDLLGWTIKDDDSDSHIISDSLTVPAGGFAVIGRDGDTTRNGGVRVDYATGSDILFHNNYDELILIDPDGVRVDRVAWDDGRTFPDPTGASMTLLNVGADNGKGSNWCKSTIPFGNGDLGTPGCRQHL